MKTPKDFFKDSFYETHYYVKEYKGDGTWKSCIEKISFNIDFFPTCQEFLDCVNKIENRDNFISWVPAIFSDETYFPDIIKKIEDYIEKMKVIEEVLK